MNNGRMIFSQVMDCLPLPQFRKCVARYDGNRKVQSFSCLDQLLCMAFAQLGELDAPVQTFHPPLTPPD